jgi:hypothetical protein
MGRIAEFFRKLFRRPAKAAMERSASHRVECSTPQAIEHTATQHDTVQHSEPRTVSRQEIVNVSWPRSPVVVKHAGFQASRQPVGRFMKHGHQAPWYRKTVKAKVRPDQEEENS